MKLLIKKIAIEKNISIKKISELCGLSARVFYKYENNISSPTLENLDRIAKALNVRVKDLFVE